MSYATRKTPRSSFFGDVPVVNMTMSPIYVKSPPITVDGGTTVSTTASAPSAPAQGFEVPSVVWWGAAALAAYWLFGRS